MSIAEGEGTQHLTQRSRTADSSDHTATQVAQAFRTASKETFQPHVRKARTPWIRDTTKPVQRRQRETRIERANKQNKPKRMLRQDKVNDAHE